MSPSQTALHTVQRLRRLLACDGWHDVLAPHLARERDRLAIRILQDDSLSHTDRDNLRSQYRVYHELVHWPEQTLHIQLGVLQAAPRTPDCPDSAFDPDPSVPPYPNLHHPA